MNFKLPKLDIPQINGKIPDIKIPDFDIPDIPDVKNVDFEEKLGQVKNLADEYFPDLNDKISEFKNILPDMSSIIPDMSSSLPDISTSMSGIDIPTIESLGVDIGDMKDLGIDTSSLESMGIDTSELTSQLDTSQITESMPELDMESMLEMPDMTPKGILSMAVGVDDITDINGTIHSLIENRKPNSIKETILSRAENTISNKIPMYDLGKEIISKSDTSNLKFDSYESLLSNDYKHVAKTGIQAYVDDKISELQSYKEKYEKAKSEVSEFISYGDTSNLDFSSSNAILHNDYVPFIKKATKGYLNSKLDKIDEQFNMSNIMSDMNLSDVDGIEDFKIDSNDLGNSDIDLSQYGIDMNYDIPDFSTDFNFSSPEFSLETDMNFTQPIRDMLNKYL